MKSIKGTKSTKGIKRMFKFLSLLTGWFKISARKTRAARALEFEFTEMGKLGQRLLVGTA